MISPCTFGARVSFQRREQAVWHAFVEGCRSIRALSPEEQDRNTFLLAPYPVRCMQYIHLRMDEMPASKRGAYHHGDLRATLVALARETLEQDGPEALALRGLAERAGVSSMAPYRHFADKAALLEAVSQQGFAELGAELVAVDDAAEPAKALTAFAIAYVRFALARPGLFRLMFGGAPAPGHRLAADPNPVFGLFTARLAQLVPPPEQRVAFLACWSSIHGLASLLASNRLLPPAPSPTELASQITEIMVKGLLA